MTELVLLTLASLGAWDVVRRLLPTRVPVVIGKLAVVMIAYCLLKYAPHTIVLPLCVPGVLLLVGRVLAPEPYVPWGSYVMDMLRLLRRAPRRQKQPASRAGHRIPDIGGLHGTAGAAERLLGRLHRER